KVFQRGLEMGASAPIFHELHNRMWRFFMSASKENPDSQAKDPAVDTSEQLEVNEGEASPEAVEAQEQIEAEKDWATLLSEAEAKIAQYHEELLRARAETENIRRRAQEDVAKARKFGTESFAESLIPVRDSLEAALALSDQTAEAWREGVEATLRQVNTAFERNLLREVAPAAGEKFDPHHHQAISTVPSEHPEGTVAQMLQK